jgi:hypothetical protein
MTQIRCIKPINGYVLNQIITVPTTGLSFAYRSISGGLAIKDLGQGNRILFVVDDAIDTVGDNVRVQAPDSLHQYFSFDLTIPDPNEPDENVNCSLIQLLESTPPSSTYDNGDNIFRIVPFSPNMVFEFATEKQGITKSGQIIINIVYYSIPKNPDGSYSVRVNATGLVETILIRQVGCTSTNINPFTNDFYGGRFHAYLTDDGGGIVDPPTGDKIYVPIGAFRWDGFYDDYLLTPRQGIGGQTYGQGINITSSLRVDLTEFASANVVPFYGEQNLPTQTIPIIDVNSLTYNPVTDQNDFTTFNKNVTCKFNLTPTAMEKEIGFAKDAGIDFWAFLWYSPYDSPLGEAAHKFIQTANKQGLKMCYTSGPIGWNIGLNIDYMTDKMIQSYYQKIDGKPLFFCNTGWPHLSAVQASYSAKSGGGQLYVCELGGYNNYPSTSNDASSIYITVGLREAADGFISELPHSKITSTEIAERNAFMNNSNKDIIPCVTTGAENYQRRSSLNSPPVEYWTARASNADMDAKHTALISFVNANPRCKAVVYYSWNENSESGNPICPTLAAGTSSVNVATINTAGVTAGVNRSTLDKIKQYCKK